MIHKRCSRLVMACLFAAITVPAGAEQNPSTTTAPATWDAAQWRAVLARLAAGTFQEREQAAAELAKLGVGDIADLKAHVSAAGDPEVQGRLQARIRELEGPQLTLSLSAPAAVRFGEPCTITFHITNHRPEAVHLAAGKVYLAAGQWSTYGMGGTARDDSITATTGADPKADVVIPGGATISCQWRVTKLTSICLGKMTSPFRLFSSDPKVSQLWGSSQPEQTVAFEVLPSALMESIYSSPTDNDRAKTQEGVNALLRAAAGKEAYAERDLLEATIANTGAYIGAYVEHAAHDADPVLREMAIKWYPRASSAVSNLNGKIRAHDSYVPPAWAQGLVAGDSTQVEKASIDAAVAALKDPQPAVRCCAVSVLTDRSHHDSLAAVTALMKDPVPAVRMAVMGFLRQFGAEPEVCRSIVQGLNDSDGDVRDAALSALERSRGLPPLDLLRDALAKAKGADAVRLLTLVVEQDGQLPQAYSDHFADGTDAERMAVLSAITGRVDDNNLQLVRSGLGDPSPAIQRVALLRLLPFPRDVALPLVTMYQTTAPADLRPVADAVAKELDHRGLFPFLESAPAAKESTFPAPNGTVPRVSPDGQWVAYTETGRGNHGTGGFGRSNLASNTHVVRADATGDQVVSDMFLVQWLADSNRVGTARDGHAAISDRDGAIVGEFGVATDPVLPLDNSWIKKGEEMPHAKYLRGFSEGGEDAAFSPDGKWYGPYTHEDACEFLNTDGTTTTIGLKKGEHIYGQAVWSPDDRYVACWGENGMTILDFQEKHVATSLPIEATTTNGFQYRKARWDPWSKDGKHLTFVRDGQIWTCLADGTGARQVTFDATQKASPAFSRDGKRIAYVTWLDDKRVQYSREKTCSNLWVVDVESTLAVRITATAPGTICSLDWLTDQTVIFDRLTPANWSEAGALETVSLIPVK